MRQAAELVLVSAAFQVDVEKDAFDYAIAIATAVGTLGAVFAAVYISIVREHRDRPRLRIAWDSPVRGSGDQRAVDLVVRNDGRRVAQEVELAAVGLTVGSRKTASVWHRRRPIGFVRDAEIDVAPVEGAADISPGGERTARLAVIGPPEAVRALPWRKYLVETEDESRVRGFWLTMPLPSQPMFAVRSDTRYRVQITVAAANADLETYEAELTLRDVTKDDGPAVDLSATALRRRSSRARDGRPQTWSIPMKSEENRGSE
jgi:hypothetical protein